MIILIDSRAKGGQIGYTNVFAVNLRFYRRTSRRLPRQDKRMYTNNRSRFFSGFLSLGLCAGVLPVLTTATASAQIDQGSISGTIQDPTGAVIAHATLTLVDTETNLTLTRTTNNAGQYTFAPIKIGNYSLKVEAPGFTTVQRTGISVDVSSQVGLNLKLQPGSVSQVVEVRSAEQLQTQEATTGQVFTQRELNDTPLENRNYLFLAQLTTGVNPPNQGNSQTAGSGAFSSNGSRVSQNDFVLDGVDNNSNMQDFLNGATYAVLPPPDALGEVRVESSDYSAELGRGTGAAINASIKSGTNHVHGSLWEYFRSDRMAATDYFNTSGPTAYHDNIFGATLGGPILRDKLFIFADAQGTRISQFRPEEPNNTVPTDLIRNGDFSEMLNPANTAGNGAISLYKAGGNITTSPGSAETAKDPNRYYSCPSATAFFQTSVPGQNVICPADINPVAQRILKLFPEPNQGAAHQVFNNYTIPATATTNNTTQYDVRVDYNLTAKDQAFARYSYSNNPTTFAPPFPILDGGGFGSDGQNSNYSKSGVISETHFFSPTLSNEFRVGYNWLHASYLQVGSQTNVAAEYGLGGIPFGPSLGGFPDIGFGGYINGIGIPSYMPSNELQNVIEFIDNVSKVAGKHTIKAGVNIQHVRFYGLQSPNPTGSENFSGTYTGDPGDVSGAVTGSGVADFELDQMNSSSINSDTPFTDVRYYDAAYIQDDWKVLPNLTLNMGLRWEYTQPFVEVHDQQANFIGNYAGMNQGSGTFLIPESQKNYPIPASIANDFALDHITVKYTSNRSLVNPNYHEFAPRLGFAYQPNDKQVLRGGFGIFYGGQENIGLGLNLFNNPPFYLNSSYNPVPNQCYNTAATGVVCPTNGQTLETGFGAAVTTVGGLGANANLPTLFQQDQNASSAYTEAYNLSLQQAVSASTSFTISYQANQSRRLRVSYGANQFPGVVPSGANGQLYQPFYDFGNIVRVTNEGSGNYNSLQLKINRHFTNGFSYLAGYTWSHSLDDAVQPIQGADGGTAGNPAFLGLGFQYGASVTDVRNRFTLASEYELPFGRGKVFLNHGLLLDELIGGWKLSGIFQVQSGTPIAFANKFKVGNPFGTGGTPNLTTQHNVQCAGQVKTLQHWFNPCAFANAPVAVAPGTATTQYENYVPLAQAGTLPFGGGRITIPGPGFNRLDLSLFKSFALPVYHSHFELRADGFNVFNHPSFGDPNDSITGSNAGSITSTRYSSILPDARVLEVAGRLVF
jgi:hypothetical protein